MNKQIILDIETTGLDFNNGDRLIEICCLEIINRKITNNIFHFYVNPETSIKKEAYLIHGISDLFLKDKPVFSSIVFSFLDFIKDSDIIIHNAQFDVSFLNLELRKLHLGSFENYCKKIIDTLVIARNKFPGKRNSLNSLCKRFNINVEDRKLHSATLDTTLLARVYLALTINQSKLFLKKNTNEDKLKVSSNNIILKAKKKDLLLHDSIVNRINNNKLD